LAERIASPTNPLTARVFVNRVWGQLIGRPLVNTPSNFGALGEPPTHPQLLDDLAVRFVRQGWSLKWLIREIVTSATYRQSSFASPDQHEHDPANHYLSHMHRKRLSVEAWRDTLLAASGQIDHSLGGPSIDPSDPGARRRTVYAFISRFELNPLLATFDFPDANVHASRRMRTTTPIQMLLALNHPFLLRQAESLTEVLPEGSVATDSDAALAQRVETLYRRLYARLPSAEELRLAETFVRGGSEDPRANWIEYAHALITANEMQFLD
jgi:hypothetical protein